MAKNYRDELLNLGFNAEIIEGTKIERTFFSINADDLENIFHVDVNDSVETARKKIQNVCSKEDFLYEYFNKDKSTWELKEYTTGYWTVPVKEEKILTKQELKDQGYSDSEIKKMRLPVKVTNSNKTMQQKLTIKFVKRAPINVLSEDALEEYFKQHEDAFIKYLSNEDALTCILKNSMISKSPKVKNKSFNDSKLLVIPDVELHLGKLASKFDSQDSYDYKKALYRYVKIILEAEKVQSMYKAKEICMTIGNDFYNTDTEQNTTTAGTEQHNDTRFQQMIANGIVAHTWAIERMKKTCDKIYLNYNPGNHDYLTDYTLFLQLYMMYKDDPKVEIDCTVKNSRWATSLKWKRNLIIFAHSKTPEGKALNDDKLSLLGDTMFKEESKNVDYITVIAGHFHTASKKRASNGVTVLRSGSPCGDGAWDSGNLYSSDKSHQVYVFDADRGLYSTVNITLTKEELEKGISVQSINEDTNYLETISKSLDIKSKDIIASDLNKAKKANDKQIKAIEDKYKRILQKLPDIMSSESISDEKKNELLELLGYNEEIKPYLAERDKLNNEAIKKFKKVN